MNVGKTVLGALPRRIALVVPPRPGEALLSWLNAMAADHGISLSRAAQITGVLGEGQTSANLVLPQDAPIYGPAPGWLRRATAATGLSASQLTDMTWHRFRGTALAPFGDGWVEETRRNMVTSRWIEPSRLKLCPACTDEAGGRWQLAWCLPWVFACVRHACYLIDACPDCGGPFGVLGTDPVAGHCPLVHDLSARPRRRCRAPLQNLSAPLVRDAEILALQRLLLDHLGAAPESSGQARADFLDLWAMACLALFVAGPGQLDGADHVVVDAFARFCRQHGTTRGRIIHNAKRRQPGVLVTAAVIRMGARIVFADDPLAAAEALAHVRSDRHSPSVIALRRAFHTGPLIPADRNTTDRVASVMQLVRYEGRGFAPPPSQRHAKPRGVAAMTFLQPS